MSKLIITEANVANRRVGNEISFSLNGTPYAFKFFNKEYNAFNRLNTFEEGEIPYSLSFTSPPKIDDYVAVLRQLQIKEHHGLIGYKSALNEYTIESQNGDVFSNVSTNTEGIKLEIKDSSINNGFPYQNPNDVLVFSFSNSQNLAGGGFLITINGVEFSFRFVADNFTQLGSFEIPVSRLDYGVSFVGVEVLRHIAALGVDGFYGEAFSINRNVGSSDRIISLRADKPLVLENARVYGGDPINISIYKKNGSVGSATILQNVVDAQVGVLSGIGVPSVIDNQQSNPTPPAEPTNIKYRILAGAPGPEIGFDVRKPVKREGLFVASSTEIKASSKIRVASEIK